MPIGLLVILIITAYFIGAAAAARKILRTLTRKEYS